MQWAVLDSKRRAVLPVLSFTKGEGFYLAGGTALALRLGHRESIDFDFFKSEPFDPQGLLGVVEAAFVGHTPIVVQQDKFTLTVLADETIKMSFFGYRYPLLQTPEETPHFLIAGIRDIAARKLAAIVGRSLEKDYVDLFYLLQHMALSDLLADARKKMPSLDPQVILKALVYFDDVEREELVFRKGYAVAFETVQESLQAHVRELVL